MGFVKIQVAIFLQIKKLFPESSDLDSTFYEKDIILHQ